MRIILTAIFVIVLLTAKSQTLVFAPTTVTVKCPDSLGYVTNVPGTRRSVDFNFENETPATLYLVENFSRKDFDNLLKNNNRKPLSRVKLVESNYQAKPYDFVFCYSTIKDLQFYYILKNQQEEETLQR